MTLMQGKNGRSGHEMTFTRRGFLNSAAIAASATVLYGCSKNDSEQIVVGGGTGSYPLTPPAITEEIMPFTGAHNCGGRGMCLSRALVKNGRVMRILTDESMDYTIDESNIQQARSCSRCRAYKGRINNPGRLKYPMKQTKERGDLTGFIRISWQQAAAEIAAELKKTLENKYEGPQAILRIYATANSGLMAGYGPFNNFLTAYAGGQIPTRGSYSTHQVQHMGTFNGVGTGNLGISYDLIKSHTKYAVLWGYHGQTTSNPKSWPTIQAMEGVKARGGKVYYIGPTMQDSCGSLADEWVPIKPGTDIALCSAITYTMVYELDSTGKKQQFIKKSTYGFFPSVGYWINAVGEKVAVIGGTTVQNITDEYDTAVFNSDNGTVNPYTLGQGTAATDWRFIKPIPIGKSYSCYLKGEADWVNAANEGSAKYIYKKHMRTLKNAEWAEPLTGVSAAKIRELAAVYYGEEPVWTRRSYGVQRQYAGVYQIFAMDNMIIASGQWGRAGSGLDASGKNSSNTATIDNAGFINHTNRLSAIGNLSCTAWSVVAREQGFNEDGSIPQNNGGDVAARYAMKRKTTWKPFSDTDAFTKTGDFYDLELDENGKPVPVGFKIVFNMGGNITGNQHMDTFQTASWIVDKKYIRMHVVMDNFLSSSARYADYVLPDVTNLEREDIVPSEGGDSWVATSEAQKGPGESITIYEFCALLCTELGKLYGTGSEYYDKFTQGLSYKQWVRRRYNETAKKSTYTELKGLTYEEFRTAGILKFSADAAPVIKEKSFRDGVNDPNVKISPLATEATRKYSRPLTIPEKGTQATGKYPAYAVGLVEDYLMRGYRIWGQLDAIYGTTNKYVVKNVDSEGDPLVYPIPVFFPPEEYAIMDGMFNGIAQDPNGHLSVLANHDKYRSHSTHNENVYLRELYKYSEKSFDAQGNRMLANDSATYSVMPEPSSDNKFDISNSGGDGLSQFWINKKDADKRGIKHMDILRAYNARGSVKVVANVTDRVVPGTTLLTQGSWFDPIEIKGVKVDIGGCYNSIAGDYRSIADHGNAHMLTFVYVKKWDLD